MLCHQRAPPSYHHIPSSVNRFCPALYSEEPGRKEIGTRLTRHLITGCLWGPPSWVDATTRAAWWEHRVAGSPHLSTNTIFQSWSRPSAGQPNRQTSEGNIFLRATPSYHDGSRGRPSTFSSCG